MNRSTNHIYCQLFVAVAGILIITSESKGDLEFTTTWVDKGEVRAGSALSHQFAFTNRGHTDVEITYIQSSCGCLTPHLSIQRYSQGEKGTLTIEINTLSPAPGPHSWQVKVFCRAGDEVRVIPLQIKAQLVREIVVEPAAINVVVEDTVQSVIHLTDLRSKPLSILAVDTSAPGLSARLDGDEKDSMGHLVRRVLFQVHDTVADGRHEEALKLYTNDPIYREIKVPVTVVKHSKSRLSASPNRVEFTSGPGMGSPVRMVLIRDKENQEVEVEAASSDHPGISCRWAKGPGSMTTVKIRFEGAPVPEANLHATIRVQVIKPIRQTVTIPIILSSEAKTRDKEK
jgi:hypothetical protein